jgi:parallel beta-helix repeat protein
MIGYDYGLLVKGTLHAQPGTKFGIPDTVEEKWKGIDIEGTATLNAVTIEDAERGITVIPGSNATITGCTLNNNIAGIHVYGTAQLIIGAIFKANLYGVKEEIGSSPVLVGCIFDHNIIDYYHQTLTRITIDELNLLGTNSNNARQGE